ncbi:MAG: cobalamin biosynthesis protein CobD [Rhizobiales bacterium]|nr:cobalamin biosynthesis protein CobD [Hyphomicrobiales bacterium]
MWPLLSSCPVALALLIERFMGYPKVIQDAVGHPVQWMGWLISKLEINLNVDVIAARKGGSLALTLLLIVNLSVSIILAAALSRFTWGWALEAVLATAFFAQRSMRDHVAAVASGLARSLEDGRAAVSHIVGRDPQNLDEAGISRAALESMAENTSDGIVAPAFWYALLGLPGLVAYKAINTADSMIGHRNERYIHFGWAAAKLDDLVNFIPARLTGLLFAASAALANPTSGRAALTAMSRDARNHQSPNAGWPEAAMAGALGLRFGGPRDYDGETVDLAWMGDGRESLARDDITEGLRLYDRSLTLLFIVFLSLCLIF